ncbi:MAG TPA: zf-HC2 domain-containing protein [Blastocatellia bacterium]|nr:zf-HC2 domain-containing protein [Blastocatellia bacterium]
MLSAFVKQLMRPGCWRYQRLLSPYLDGALDRSAAARVESHLAVCASCRTQSENLRFASRLVANLELREAESTPYWFTPEVAAHPLRQSRKLVFILAPAAVLLMIAVVAVWYFIRGASASLEVARLSGQPVIESIPIDMTARLRTGEWLETDGRSRALIQVGQIGEVEVDPRSRVRLVKTGANEHRLELARGRLYASVVAPPRLFQVQTPSAVAIDLGCAYTLDVDESGGSLLHVTSGWVALERNGRESFVPAGALCRAEPDGRLGAPYFEDSSARFQQALTRFDFGSDKANAFAVLLAEARVRDALTLWHLLARVGGNEREQTYDRLVALIPSAQALSKADTLRLDPATMARWKEAVEFAALGVDSRKIPVAAGTLKSVGPMLAMRTSHTATLLPNGKVLIAGGGDRDVVFASAELFDPATGGFSETGQMTTPRAGHEATLLPGGKVLITGGVDGRFNWLASAELYDPATRRFAPAGEMTIAREAHCATLLNNGKVLITGGLSPVWPEQQLAEIYDPVTGAFSPTGEMTSPRADHTATLLSNGQVLLAAGSTGRSINEAVTQTAELFDPATNRFTATGNLAAPRHKHAAVGLRDGKVLVIGGADSRLRGFYNSAELYDPATGKFSATGAMSSARYKIRDAAALLADGRALVAGGGTRLEIYDPATGVFSLLPDRVTSALRYSTTTLLGDGTALIAGGYGGEGLPSAGAWLFDPKVNR